MPVWHESLLHILCCNAVGIVRIPAVAAAAAAASVCTYLDQS